MRLEDKQRLFMPKDEYYKYGKSPAFQKKQKQAYLERLDDPPLRNINPYTMPFGKYKGQLLGIIPVSYLEWIVEQSYVDQTLKNRILCNIRYRSEVIND